MAASRSQQAGTGGFKKKNTLFCFHEQGWGKVCLCEQLCVENSHQFKHDATQRTFARNLGMTSSTVCQKEFIGIGFVLGVMVALFAT